MAENSEVKKRIDFCYAKGYDIIKFLTDNNIEDPIVYIDMGNYDTIELFVYSLQIVNDGHTRFCSDKETVLQTAFDCKMGKNINVKKYTDIQVSQEDTVLLLTNNPKSLEENVLKYFSDARAKCMDMHYIVVKMVNECCYNVYYKELRKIHPNVTFVNIVYPHFPANNRSEYENYVIKNNYTVFQLCKDLDTNNIPKGISSLFNGLSNNEIKKTLEVRQQCLNHSKLDIDDKSNSLNNVCCGNRITCGNPNKYEKTIYLFGNCIVYGFGATDDKTIASILQENFNSLGKFVRIINEGRFIPGRYPQLIGNIKNTSFKDGDIVCLFSVFPNKDAHYNIDLINLFNRPHEYGDVFLDNPHLSMKGMKIVAKMIFEFLIDIIDKPLQPTENSFTLTEIKSHLSPDEEQQLSEYLKSIEEFIPKRPKIGSIVMNCNPFTLGHRYLIEQSAAKVEKLFVFVVEEDKSIFPFADRIELVRKGTADLKNVVVLPSGKFMISALTFTDYFGKSEIQDRIIDPSMDVNIFGEYIAPAVGINIRFAGEEPLDNVTKQYNETMARILPKYGVDFEVIPRKEFDGEVISASRVRKLLETGDFEAISHIVPKTTLDYLTEKYKANDN